MENQHRKISGYRDLSQAEIDLMNRIKAHAEATRQLVVDVLGVVEPEPVMLEPTQASVDALSQVLTNGEPEAVQMLNAELMSTSSGHRAGPQRWVDLAGDHLQQGFMALARAVAQPATY